MKTVCENISELKKEIRLLYRNKHTLNPTVFFNKINTLRFEIRQASTIAEYAECYQQKKHCS